LFHLHAFSANLRAARKRMGLSQKDLAEKLYVSVQAVSKWERGESTPDLNRVCELSELLRIPVGDLLGAVPQREAALIAVDGGGTKTEFVLISLSGQLLRRLILPGSNPNICTVAGTCDILRRGIDALLREGHPVLAVNIGGAGFFSGNNGLQVEEAMQKAYPGMRLRCESDICNVLSCAEDPDNAIALICGTGAVAYASKAGQLRRCGGGGWRLETLGSGYDLGRAALLAALEHRDDTGAETALTQAVEEKLGGRVWDRIQEIYSSDTAGIAAFAPLVIQAWQAGDRVAEEIVKTNVRRLAYLVEMASRHSPNARQGVLGGSLLTQCPPMRRELAALLPKNLEHRVMEHPQVWGACLRCARLAQVPAPELKLFMQKYQKED